MFHGLGGRFSPGKRRVTSDQHAGNSDGVKPLAAEAADDDGAGVAHIGLGDFFCGERLGHRNRAVEVVGVGGTEAGNGPAGLCPGGGELRVGVDDAANLGKLAVEQGVGVQIA